MTRRPPPASRSEKSNTRPPSAFASDASKHRPAQNDVDRHPVGSGSESESSNTSESMEEEGDADALRISQWADEDDLDGMNDNGGIRDVPRAQLDSKLVSPHFS